MHSGVYGQRLRRLNITGCLLLLEAHDGSASVVQTESSGHGEQPVEWVHQSLRARSSQPQLLVGMLVQLLQFDNSLWVHGVGIDWSIDLDGIKR